MMTWPTAIELYAEIHMREVRRRMRHQQVVNLVAAVLVALVLSSTWWL